MTIERIVDRMGHSNNDTNIYHEGGVTKGEQCRWSATVVTVGGLGRVTVVVCVGEVELRRPS